VNGLRFARDLARFQADLEDWAVPLGDGGWADLWADQWAANPNCHLAPAIAASYLHLLDRLTVLGDDEAVAQILAGAIKVYDAAVEVYDAAASRAARDRDVARQKAEAEYAEAVRRHEVAITADCPYCGAEPGRVCRTAGPSGIGNPKGVHDHADRYRAALLVLGPPPGDEVP
jgi:hypothetical protein